MVIRPNVRNSINNPVSSIGNLIRANPITSAVTVGSIAALGTAGAVVGIRSAVKKRKSRKSHKKKKYATKRRRRGRRTPRTAGKGRDRSTKRIRYTKNGQPYVITRSGKAKFIKRSSAKRSHKKRGGRY